MSNTVIQHDLDSGLQVSVGPQEGSDGRAGAAIYTLSDDGSVLGSLRLTLPQLRFLIDTLQQDAPQIRALEIQAGRESAAELRRVVRELRNFGRGDE